MNITGEVKQALPEVQGVAKNGQPWRKREYVIEVGDRYPRKICMSVMNGNIDTMNLQEGHYYCIDFDVESREYQGKWYHSITAFRATMIR